MAVGRISTSILTDIANAIRWQNGTGSLYRPREMAGAVVALDGGNDGGYVEQPYMELASGVPRIRCSRASRRPCAPRTVRRRGIGPPTWPRPFGLWSGTWG